MSASVWQAGAAISANNSVRFQPFVATANQTLFEIPPEAFAYVPGTSSLLVFQSSGAQRPGIDFVETSSSSFTMVTPVAEGTIVLAMAFVQVTATLDALQLRADLANASDPSKGAELVAFKRTEANSVATTVEEHVRKTVFSSEFTTLQAAIDAVAADGGGLVYLDADTSSSTIAMRSLVEVIGTAGTYVGTSSAAAVGKRVITITGAGGGVAFGDGATGVYGAALRNCEVYTTTGVDGIVLNGGPGSPTVSCEIENVRCNGFSNGGIVSKGHAFTNRIIRSGGANCDIGIDLQEEANDTVIEDPQCSANRINVRIGDGSGVSQDGIILIAGNNDSSTEEGILIGLPTNSISIIAPYVEGSGKEPIKCTSTAATLTIQGGKLIGSSATYDNINLAAGCIFDISGVAFGGDARYDLNLSAAASYYGRLGPCRHGSTVASGRIGNSATGDSTLDLTNTAAPSHTFVGSLDLGTITTFTPTWVNLTIGDASINTASSVKIGKHVHVSGHLKMGATTSVTGAVSISNLPHTSGSLREFGESYYLDSGTEEYAGRCQVTESSTSLAFKAIGSAAAYTTQSNVTATVPHTWAVNDEIRWSITYLAAS